MNMTKTGRLITRLRMGLGLTQAQLAQRLDVTDKAVSKWERGKGLPDVALLNRLAAELRVSVVEILSGETLQVARSSNLDGPATGVEETAASGPCALQFAEPSDLMVPAYLFGSNLEHTRSCIHNGLSAQMLRNRKFAGKPSACNGCAMEWFPIGENAVFTFDQPYTRHGEGYHMNRLLECNSLSILNPCQGKPAGLGQHGLFLQKGKPYLFGMVVRAKERLALSVALTDRTGDMVYDRRTLTVEAADWTRYEIELTPNAAGPDADLRIFWEEPGALCREIGAEPFITINPCWNTPEENAAWVEYCNGDSSTKYGGLRAERGHPEPYHVQFWSLGNEFGYGHMEGDNTPGGYCQTALENGRKMLAVSPNLSLCSSGPYPNKEWAELSARPLSGIAQLVSQHYYGYEPKYTDPSSVEQEYNRCMASVSRMRGLIRQNRQWLEPNVRISFDEWNVWYAWYRPSSVTDGIYAALVMHLLIEEADKSGIALACHFQAVNEGMLQVGPDRVGLTAQGQAFSLMKRHMGNRLCSASQEAVVTLTPEGEHIATIVNPSFDQEKTVDISQCGPCREAALLSSETVLPPSAFTETGVLEQTGAGSFRMPPHSVLLLRFSALAGPWEGGGCEP